MDKAEYIRKVVDPTFSKWVRLGNSTNGICKCVTCSTEKHFTEMDAGHFIPRGNMATRYDTRNCKPQCISCNRLCDGMHLAFEWSLLALYGQEVVEDLKIKAKTIRKYNVRELEQMVAVWKESIAKWERDLIEGSA